jgi:hypothetical protein
MVAGAVWSSVIRANERCSGSGAWVELDISGKAWSVVDQENVLRELRVELGRRSLEVCLHSEAPSPSPPKAVVTLLANDADVVSIVPSRIQDEGGFTGRTIRVGSIPADARALAIAQAIDEVLRGERPAPEPVPPPGPAMRDVARDVVVPAPRPMSPSRFGVAVGPAIQVAPASSMSASADTFAVGAAFRAAATSAYFGGSLGLVLPTSTKLGFGSITIDQLRVPVDASARARMKTGELEGAFDLGFVLAFLREEFAPAHAQVRAEPGVRAGLTLSWGERIVPWLGASVEWVPAPYQFRFAPEGAIGQSSKLWLGLAVGVEVRWR